MHFHVKHAALINSCYPEKEGEKGPRASELSYLTFYASSRPVKLTKVGTFLKAKVERDISKGRKQNNQVSLDIIKALIQSCDRELNRFSNHIVQILNMILGTRDIDLMDIACETFIVFCSHHDGAALGVDNDLTADYEHLISQFAGFCTFSNNDEMLTLQTQYIGQCALQASVISKALQASNLKAQLNIILPPLIKTLSLAKKPANVLAKSKDSVDIRIPARNNDNLSKYVIDGLAAQTTSRLFKMTSGTAVRIALEPLFTYMDKEEKWWPPNFAVSIMELALDSLQPQCRSLLVSEVMQQLNAIKNADGTAAISKQASLVAVMDMILNAKVPLVGISALEVLNSLFTHLIKSVQHYSLREEQPQPDDVNGMYEYAIHQGLAHSIGGLATQTYYQNQLDDMTGYIIQKLRAGTTLEQVEGMPIVEFRRVAIKCLDLIASASQEDPEPKDEATAETEQPQGSSISLDTWVPAINLLKDKSIETRISFATTLERYLDATTENNVALEPFPKHTLHQHGDLKFINALHKTIVDWVQLPDFGVRDVRAMFAILCTLTRRFGADGTIKAIPLIFKLQSLVQDGIISQKARQRAVAAAIVEWLEMVGHFYHIERLVEYAGRLREERKSKEEYSSLFLNQAAGETVGTTNFDTFESDNDQDVHTLVDRHEVVEIISKDGPLRDEGDTNGLELESKLYVEWGSEAFKNHERSFRIRTSRNIDDLKPKLATPWMSTDFNRSSQGKKQAVKVEHLKEALASSQMTDNENREPDSDSLHTASTKRRTDTIDTILESLTFNFQQANPQSTPSLANPPYSDV